MAGLARPTVDYDTSATPGLTRDQAIALLEAADSDAGPQAARTAALVATLLFTGARVYRAEVRALLRDLVRAAGLPDSLASGLSPHSMPYAFATLNQVWTPAPACATCPRSAPWSCSSSPCSVWPAG